MEEYKNDEMTVVGNLMNVRELYEMLVRVEEEKAQGKSVDESLSEESIRNLSSTENKPKYLE